MNALSDAFIHMIEDNELCIRPVCGVNSKSIQEKNKPK